MVSINACYELDLYASITKQECVLRVMSTNKYFLKIIPQFKLKISYKLFRVMVSLRGYIILQARSSFISYGHDLFTVYSMNGEQLIVKELDELINAVVFDQYQYFIVLVL